MGCTVEDCEGKGELTFDDESEHNPYLDMSDNDFRKLLESNGFKVVDGTGKIIAMDDDTTEFESFEQMMKWGINNHITSE